MKTGHAFIQKFNDGDITLYRGRYYFNRMAYTSKAYDSIAALVEGEEYGEQISIPQRYVPQGQEKAPEYNGTYTDEEAGFSGQIEDEDEGYSS